MKMAISPHLFTYKNTGIITAIVLLGSYFDSETLTCISRLKRSKSKTNIQLLWWLVWWSSCLKGFVHLPDDIFNGTNSLHQKSRLDNLIQVHNRQMTFCIEAHCVSLRSSVPSEPGVLNVLPPTGSIILKLRIRG